MARVCGLLHLAVSSYYYQSHGRRDEAPVRSALRRHAEVRSVVDRDYADYTSDVVLGSRREQVRKVSYSSLF